MTQPQHIQTVCNAAFGGIKLSLSGPTFFIFELPHVRGLDFEERVLSMARANYKLKHGAQRHDRRAILSDPMLRAGVLTLFKLRPEELATAGDSAYHSDDTTTAVVTKVIDFMSGLATDQDQELSASGGSAFVVCTYRPSRQVGLQDWVYRLVQSPASSVRFEEGGTGFSEDGFWGKPRWTLDCKLFVHSPVHV